MASNGKIPSADLVELSTPGALVAAAARSYEALRDDAGVTGTTSANHAYRDLDEQARLFEQNYQRDWCEYAPGKVDKRGPWEGDYWYRKPGHNATAVPGTSNHGLGVAVDWQGLGGYGSSSWQRFADLAPAYGWDNTEGAYNDEAWHWTYDEHDDRGGYEMQAGEWFDYAIPLNTWMKHQFDDGKETLTAKGSMGYAAAGAYTSANALTELVGLMRELIEVVSTASPPAGSGAITEADVEAIARASAEAVLDNIALTGTITVRQIPGRRRRRGWGRYDD